MHAELRRRGQPADDLEVVARRALYEKKEITLALKDRAS